MNDLFGGFAAINLAYVALLFGAFNQSLHRVRLLLVVAGLFFVVYGTIQGIGSMVVWNLVIGGLHLYRLVNGMWSDGRVSLTAAQNTVRLRHFATVAPIDFLRFWEAGHEETWPDGPLPSGDDHGPRMQLIIGGRVVLWCDDAPVDVLGPGAIIDPAVGWRRDPRNRWLASGWVRLRSWPVEGHRDPDPVRRVLSGTAPHTRGWSMS